MLNHLVVLDVREFLQAKQDPFEQIMAAVARLNEEDVFELHATFCPDPMIKKLMTGGFRHAWLEWEPEHFVVQFYKEATDLPTFHIDNRALQPPEPLVRTLDLLSNHKPFEAGEMALEIWNLHAPALLFPELDERDYQYRLVDEGADLVRVRIWRDQ